MKIIARLSILVFIITPLIAWYIVKPIRVISPDSDLLYCKSDFLCAESQEDIITAQRLYNKAIKSLTQKLGEFKPYPKVIFCSTIGCDNYFGLSKRSAITFGLFGTVISSRAWKQYYVEHEIIHYLQYEKLGYVKVLLLPSWLKEGMAYSISNDPRPKLESPWQEYRAKFESRSTNKQDVWQFIDEQ